MARLAATLVSDAQCVPDTPSRQRAATRVSRSLETSKPQKRVSKLDAIGRLQVLRLGERPDRAGRKTGVRVQRDVCYQLDERVSQVRTIAGIEPVAAVFQATGQRDRPHLRAPW